MTSQQLFSKLTLQNTRSIQRVCRSRLGKVPQVHASRPSTRKATSTSIRSRWGLTIARRCKRDLARHSFRAPAEKAHHCMATEVVPKKKTLSMWRLRRCKETGFRRCMRLDRGKSPSYRCHKLSSRIRCHSTYTLRSRRIRSHSA